MKKFYLTIVVTGFTVRAFCQGAVALDNFANSSMSPTATSDGLFWLSIGGTPSLINQDFNAAFYAGSDSGSLSLLATFLLSDGTAAGVNGVRPGTFVDPRGNEYFILGATTEAFFRVEAWTGNLNSYTAAVNAGGPAARSPIFLNPVSVPPGGLPDLVGLPAMVLAVPEPSVFALIGLGGLCALVFLGRHKNNRLPCSVVTQATRLDSTDDWSFGTVQQHGLTRVRGYKFPFGYLCRCIPNFKSCR